MCLNNERNIKKSMCLESLITNERALRENNTNLKLLILYNNGTLFFFLCNDYLLKPIIDT